MEYYAGIDVSLEQSSVCVVDEKGQIIRKAKVPSDPAALAALFAGLAFPMTRIGLEAGPLSQWLHEGLTDAGHEVVLLETRHVKAALSAMTVKTDRKDARGIAQLPRMGWFRSVHRKSLPAQETRVLLTVRKLLLQQDPRPRQQMRRGLALANEIFKPAPLLRAQPDNVFLDADILRRHESSPPLQHVGIDSENSINAKDAR